MTLCVRILRIMKLSPIMKKFLNKNDGIIRIIYLFNLGEFPQYENDSKRVISPLPTAIVDGESSTANLLSLIEDRGLLVAIGERITYMDIITLNLPY